MREQVRDKGRLEHILEAIDRVFQFTNDISRDDFKKDSILYFAIVKNIEIIGEASYMLSTEFKESHPDTDWKVIVAMRHFLVHGYYQVDPDEIWNVVTQDFSRSRIKYPGILLNYNAESPEKTNHSR